MASAIRPARSGHPEGRKWALKHLLRWFYDMAECHVVYSGNPSAFFIIVEAILRFGLQNDQISTGFIRYFDHFPMPRNVLGPMPFCHFAKS